MLYMVCPAMHAKDLVSYVLQNRCSLFIQELQHQQRSPMNLNEVIVQAGLPPALGLNNIGPEFPKKVFAKSFRLVFTCHSRGKELAPDGQGIPSDGSYITWIKVKSLAGLENVANRVANGELAPVNAWATLDRQLWGLLAEHTGFLRYAGPEDDASSGLQPLGVEQAQLCGDMSELFGGFEPAIAALSEMRRQIVDELEAKEPIVKQAQSEFLKDDGINLTPEGEAIIAKEIYGPSSAASLKLKMDTANAEVLAMDTDITDSPVGDPVAEFDAAVKELQTITGDEATEQGRLVERAADGDLEDEEEVGD